MILLLLQYGPVVIGLLLAIAASFVGRRSRVRLPRTARISTTIGMVVALGCMTTFTAWRLFPQRGPTLGDEAFLVQQFAGYLVPLVLSIVALLSLIPPLPVPGPHGSAQLAPRTLVTFASRRWLAAAAGVIVAVIVVSVLAGLGSSPDDAGRYVLYQLHASSMAVGGTTIYGWWYSLPCLIVIAIIVALTLLVLVVISRPALAADSQRDVAARTVRVRNVLMVSTGGLLLHLGTILQSLYNASTVRTGLEAGQAGLVVVGTPFATIGPALYVASFLTIILGMTMWWFTLLSARPSRTLIVKESVLT